MSLSNVLGKSLNIFKTRPFCNAVLPGRSFCLAQKYPVSSVGYHYNYEISSQKIIPQNLKAEVKLTDAVRQFSTTPAQYSAHGDHSQLWVYERYVSAALLGIIPLGLMMPNILFDLLIAVASVMHMHWGIEAIVVDYIRPIIFGNVIPKIAVLSVYVLSIFTLVGLLNLIFNNIGLANTIRSFWRLNKEDPKLKKC